jgi:hypothetical protein
MDDDQFWTRSWGVDRLAAFVRDPYTIFVYWEVSEERKRLVSRHFGAPWRDLRFFLRVHDVTDVLWNGENAHETRTFGVAPDADSWYVRELQPGRDYIVDFGLWTSAGQPFVVLRGKPAETPSIGPGAVPRARFGRPGERVVLAGGEAAEQADAPFAVYEHLPAGHSKQSG